MMRVLSLGAGVQSSTLALMIAAGEVEPVNCAIFADTEGEPAAVYSWLDWLQSKLPFPVHRVSRGNLWAAVTRLQRNRAGTKSYISVGLPAYTDRDGVKGMRMRQCTRHFKIDPINAKLREFLGGRPRKRDGVQIEVLLGLSADEVYRVKPHRKPWARSVWPLIDRGMTRADCLAWMQRHSYPLPPRSACTFCPYRSDEEWLALTPEEFADACAKERELQVAFAGATGNTSVPYLHASRVPLGTVKFKPRPKGQQLSMFTNECEGICGV